MTAVADALDELLHGPSPVGLAEAIEQIDRERGQRFDPVLTAIAVRNAERFKAIVGAD